MTKACRSVPSQRYHSSDATSNREREREERREGETRKRREVKVERNRDLIERKKEREMRGREQNLISSRPLHNHMKCVDTHSAEFCGNIKELMVTKPSFQLSLLSVRKTSVSMTEHVDPMLARMRFLLAHKYYSA